MSHPIYQIVYCSHFRAARVGSPLQALRDIVTVSSRNNARDGITGYLIFDGETFLQILEGERAAVETTYARIAGDARHREATLLHAGTAEQRSFGNWAMNGYLRSEADASVFARHGVPGAIPAAITGARVMALAQELAAGQRRARPAAAASQRQERGVGAGD